MKKILLAFIVISFYNNAFSQDVTDTVTVAFWNLENLFDVEDDPIKEDEEFLPLSEKEWNAEKLDKKMYNLSRIIRIMDNDNGPDILGVCEVEHQSLLDSLVLKFLPGKKYKTAYIESPDGRGIDNGLIYNSELFSILSVKGDTIKLDDGYPTRLILNVNLLANGNDTLNLFVNHWPSRRGGEIESEINRVRAAETLKASVNKYFSSDPESKIIIMGDFNDEPGNTSILNTLEALPFSCDSTSTLQTGLFNTAYTSFVNGTGSYKYRDDWNMLDQIIISGSLLKEEKLKYICNSFEVFKSSMMVTKSGKYEGTPFPTYGGKRYLGGYSDHFPVTAKFIFK